MTDGEQLGVAFVLAGGASLGAIQVGMLPPVYPGVATTFDNSSERRREWDLLDGAPTEDLARRHNRRALYQAPPGCRRKLKAGLIDS